ncbi:histone-lysine N-methyltransferase SETMAR [Trichonephila clavipes]|nr:histone-lysine N-methyltransferase SETMAR [Trichonephila clavipes]
MMQHVKRKRLLRNGFLLLHDNARPHIVHCVLDVSQQNNIEILPHPPYSSDKTPCDFGCFFNLRNHYEANVFKQQSMRKGCGCDFDEALTKGTFTCF